MQTLGITGHTHGMGDRRMNIIEDNIDFDAYLNKTEHGAHVKSASDYTSEIIGLYNIETVDVTPTLPWSKTFGNVRLRPGEVSIWHGINGHGKSMLQGFVDLSLMQQGEKICIASFEMKPVRTLARMCRQAAGCEQPSIRFINGFGAWTDGKLWMYDHQGTVTPDRVRGVLAYCHAELGITHFVIDSLMKCGIRGDDYNRQKDFIDELTSFARDTGMHIHLVAHSRKGDDEAKPPGKMDVKGASEITDQVDNVFNVWRNKRKEAELRKPVANQSEDILEQPDQLILLDKQRNGEWEGTIALWFDRSSFQYRAHSREVVLDFGVPF